MIDKTASGRDSDRIVVVAHPRPSAFAGEEQDPARADSQAVGDIVSLHGAVVAIDPELASAQQGVGDGPIGPIRSSSP
jgi:hypothetical protein